MIAFAISVGAIPIRNATPNDAPLQESLLAARQQERAGEIQAIARRQKQVGQAEIDGQADQQTDQRNQQQPMPRLGLRNNFAVRKPASAQTIMVGATE